MNLNRLLKSCFCVLAACVALVGGEARADATYHDLGAGNFTQDWTDTGLITAVDNWDGVPSIVGYRGDNFSGSDPQLILTEGSLVVDVNHNQTSPDGFFTGGVTEFELTNPTIALAGSGTADAPYIQIFLNSTGRTNIQIAYNLRDVEGGADNSVQPIALQYRVGTTGDFTNVPAAFVADASSGPNLATLVTPVNVTLPTVVENQAQVQLRIMTVNATGNDEWIGIDDIVVSSSPNSTPVITGPVAGETAVFTTTYGVASAVQTFPVAGTDLTAPIVATAPIGFEVANDGTTWGPTASFAPSSGVVTGATLSVRLKADAPVLGVFDSAVIALTSGVAAVNLTTPSTGNSVTAAGLTIAANPVSKPVGATLAEVNPGSTAFVPTGLVNGELVGSVTITYGAGRLDTDPAAVYSGSVVPSAATGGTFAASNYSISYTAADLTVTADPIVTLGGSFTAMTAEYGTASAAQSFTVTGGALTADVVVSAPTGFEVSDAEAGTYGPSVTLTQTGGNVPVTTLYLRMKGDNAFGPVATGNVSATSTGATTQTLVVPEGSVSQKALTITGLAGVNKEYDRTNAATFTGAGVLSGVVAGDEADVVLDGTAAAAVFGQVGQGTNVAVTVTGFVLSGAKAGNYSLTQPVLTADIEAKELTLAGAAVTTRAFNGGVVATITGTLDGVILPDVVTFMGAGAFDNAGPGDPIAVTAAMTLGGADAGNYTIVQPTGLMGRINGGGTGSTIAQWTFEPLQGTNASPTPNVGTGSAVLVGSMITPGTATGMDPLVDSGSQTTGTTAWAIGGANPGTANESSGAEFRTSTTGAQGIRFSWHQRHSGTSPNTMRVQYSTDGGVNWINFEMTPTNTTIPATAPTGTLNNGRFEVDTTADRYRRCTVDFTGLAGVDNNVDFRVRVVASHYQGTGQFRQTGTPATVATGGTWRFDNVTFTGNPPFQFVGSTPAHLATEVPVSSAIQLNFSAPALLTLNAVTLKDQDNIDIPFTGLLVETTAAAEVTLTPTAPLPYGKTITATLVAAEITSATLAPLGSTTATIPVRFTTEALVAPVVNVTPTAVTSPISTDVTLTANVTAGSQPVTLQWYEGTASNFAGAALLSGSTGTTLVVQRPTVGVVSYFVRATNPGAQVADSNDAVVTFTDFPVVTSTVPAADAVGVAQDGTITLNFSKAVQLEAGAVSISPVVPFTMLPDFGGPALATSFVLTPTAPLAVGTLYTVTVDKTKVKDAVDAGMDADKVFSFTTRVPVSITTPPVPQSVLEGQNVVFSVTAVGDGPLSYEWLYEGAAFGAPNLPTLTLNGVSLSLAGNYSVKVTGPGVGNEATSAGALLTVTVPSVVITGNGTYGQNFDALGSGYPLGWKGFKASGTSAVPVGTVATPTVGDGSGNAGAVLNVGTTAQADRALGVLASGGYVGAFGVTLTNLTGQPLDGSNVKLAFTMEQWRTSSAAAKERLRFEWKLGGAINGVDGLGALETAGWNPVSAFDLVEKDEGEYPTSGPGTNGAVNGNTSNFQVVLSAASFASLGTWGPGQVLHLRWVDSNDTGNDALLAIDDFSVITEDVPPPPNLVFWDSNGLSAGAGAVPTGTWGTDGFWTADALGTTATTTWTTGADAVFSAGADAVGSFTVTLNGIQDAGSVTVEEGAVVLSGGELLLSRSPALVEVKSGGATVASVISGSEGLRKRGAGTLELQGVNTFSGTLRLGGGVTLIGADTALGNVENDFVFAGGTLATTGALTLPVTRELAGSGTLSPALGTTLTVAGPVAMSLLEVAGAGPVALTNAVVSAGVLSLKSGSELTGQPMTVGTITAVLGGGSALVGNGLNFGTSARSLAVDAGSQLTLSGNVVLGGVGDTALTKLDAGTLVLTGMNIGLNKLSIGGQGPNPNFGGRVKFNNKDALGATVIFFNYGILEATVPLTGVDALPVGASMGGRDGSPVIFTGADIELAGASRLFGPSATFGDIVIQVNNTTTFSGPFAAATSGTITGLTFGGTGTVIFTGAKDTFRAPIKLADTVTFVMDTAQLGDVTSANPVITLGSGTKLVVGAEGGTRLVTAYNGLNAETGSSVEFEIGGTTRGASYDAVDFATGAGTADIRVAGTVRVKFLSGYTPAVGHAFRLMKWDNTATRDFAGLAFDLPTLTGGLTWDTGNFASDGVIFISGTGLGPIIIGQPQGGTFANGAQVDMTVSVLGAGPFTYNWKRGGVSLGAPNSSTLSLVNVTTERSGSYSVTVTSGSLSSTSETAEVLVEGAPFIKVQPASRAVADGTSVTFGVTAVGVGPLTYVWQFAEADMVPAQTGATLDVVAGVATRGNYRVVVTNGFGSTTSAVAVLSLPTAGPATSKPEWDLLADLPAGQIGVPYAFDLNVKADLPGAVPPIFRSATSFSMSGQPTGLVINATTGEITGTPAAIKSTPYAVSVTARNAFGSAVLKTRILINPLPTGALGVFTGPIGRSALLEGIVTGGNGALGGRFDMTVASTGVASGKVTIGTKVYSFSKAKAVIPAAPANRLSVAATIKLSTTRNLTVSVLVDTLTGTILNTSTISDGVATVPLTGWRNPWSKLNPATALAGYYTTKVDLVSTTLTSAQAPLGAGYLSFTVSPTTGGLTLAGKLSDGSSISMATFAGPAGQMLMFRTLYGTTTRGSLLGSLGIAAEANPLNNTVSGPMTWTRPANTASSNRLYRSGFPAPGLLDVTVAGGRYVAPPARTKTNPLAEPRVMGLTDLSNQIEVLLTKAGVETALPLQADVKATVALTNKVAFNLDKLVNTRAMSLTFSASKGSFTGRAILKENNPVLAAAVPPVLSAVTRTVTFQGLLVGGVGHGYFILNQLPAVGAIPAQTTSNTPQEGGRVEVKVFVPPVVP